MPREFLSITANLNGFLLTALILDNIQHGPLLLLFLLPFRHNKSPWTMFKSTVCRQALCSLRSCNAAARSTSSQLPRPQLSVSSSVSTALSRSRPFSSSRGLLDDSSKGRDNDPSKPKPTISKDESLSENEDKEGRYARTDESVRVEYPEHGEMPRMPIVQGRGGRHFKRTLASFSLEDKVSIVTGGARGLGLVMAQALVASGSNVAIVDLNGKPLFRLSWYRLTAA